ncbi:hypothetical protein TYRP_009405, partial [Tyrophagus putrescentiae]
MAAKTTDRLCQLPWCRGVFEQLGGCPGATVEHPHTSPPEGGSKGGGTGGGGGGGGGGVLPYRIRKLCVAHRACGDPLVFRRPPADCKVGGLCYPFLNPLELSATEKEQLVPEKD